MSCSIKPSLGKRFASSSALYMVPPGSPTKSSPRKGRRGHLYVADMSHPPVTPEEEVRIIKRRIQKAERDERMDITLAMTPVKTYMAGFTRPRDLRTSMWLPGGPYQRRGKVYESPPEAAYEPHTVFLLESRYPVKFGLGRANSLHHILGCCIEGDFEGVMQRYNSSRAPHDAKENMDNAVWPWLVSGKKWKKMVRWWDPGENPRDVLREILGEEADTVDLGGIKEEALSSGVGNADANSQVIRQDDEILLSEEETEIELPSDTSDLPPANEGVSVVTEFPEGETPPEANAGQPPLSPRENQPDSVTPTSGAKGQLHSSSVSRATEVPLPTTSDRAPPPHINPDSLSTSETTTTPSDEDDSSAQSRRSEYLPTLPDTPFWRPLLTLTVSTRPLAATLLRLSKALPRGLPFYASIHNDDRKYGVSFGARMRCLRIARMQGLAVEMAELLGGARGGYIGIRFNVNSVGRLLDPETLASPIPWEKRAIKVGVGNWFPRVSEIKEAFALDAKEKVAPIVTGQSEEADKGAFEIFGLDEWGRRISDTTGEVMPWPESKRFQSHEAAKEFNEINTVLDEDDFVIDEDEEADEIDFMDAEAVIAETKRRRKLLNDKRRDAKLKRQDISRTYTREIALSQAQKSRAVLAP